MTTSKQTLRAALRERRRALPSDAAATAADAVCHRLLATGWSAVRDLALYRAFDGELDPEPIAVEARAAGAMTWYPIVDGDAMRFVAWDGGSPLRTGAFGIEEPATTSRAGGAEAIEPSELDLVIVPLVGFDADGHRLGMGRGYYDRTFAFLAQPTVERPRLVAVAFDEQEVDAIEVDPWDVAVDAIVTPTRVIEPRP